MNERGVVEVRLPASEFLDRYLISELKLAKFMEMARPGSDELRSWIDGHRRDYTAIVDFSASVSNAARSLARVHEQLWDLEDEVRSPEASQTGYFARTARRIFELNTERHKLKQAIDAELPSLSFGPRLYDKSR